VWPSLIIGALTSVSHDIVQGKSASVGEKNKNDAILLPFGW
jgi:hypothetical protein